MDRNQQARTSSEKMDAARLKQANASGEAIIGCAIGGQTLGFIMEIEEDSSLAGQMQKFDEEDDPVYMEEAAAESESAKCFVTPDGTSHTVWELSMVLLTLYCGFTIPWYMAWNRNASGGYLVIENVIDMFFILDVFVNFRTGFYDDELRRNVYNQKRVAIHYLTGWFPIDIISAFPLSLLTPKVTATTTAAEFSQFRAASLIRMVRTWSRMIRMVKIIKMNRMVTQIQNNYEINPTYVRIFKFVAYVSLLAHVFSCLWYWIATESREPCMERPGKPCFDQTENHTWVYNNWLHQYQMPVDFRREEQYGAAMYWTMCTITTVGYGDVAANTSGERLLSMLVMAIGASMFAFVCGNMTSIVVNFDKEAYLRQRKLDTLNNYMRKRGLSKMLKTKCRTFCRHIWQKTVFNEMQVLRDFSPGLRMLVAMEVHSVTIRSIPIFESLSETHIGLLCQRLHHISVCPGEMVVTCGDPGREMYLVESGVLDVLSKDGKTKFATLRQKAYFGDIAMIMGQTRNAHVRARTICDLHVLSIRDFSQALANYPDVLEMLRKRATEAVAQNKRREKEQAAKRKVRLTKTGSEHVQAIERGVKFNNPMNEDNESSDEDDFTTDQDAEEGEETDGPAPEEDLLHLEDALKTHPTIAAAVGAQLKSMTEEQLEKMLASIRAEKLFRVRSKDKTEWENEKGHLMKQLERLQKTAEDQKSKIHAMVAEHTANPLDRVL